MTVLLATLLFAVPGAAFWTLLGGLDPVGRLAVAVVGSITVVAGSAQVMLMAGAWSPGTGLVAVLVLSGLLAGLGRVHRRGRPPAPLVPPPRRPAAGANTTRQDIPARRREDDEEDWLYQE
ncbi:hypothetical protein [Actinomadura hibisca]|uniref:hypothetical protein n=1 Tax=Actinomadura hibisca TaxID=68565 RepID=UPI00082A746E|nr:hypothetical protein [Actinomadura hibisca]